jgi:hypothetical protein
MTIGAVGYSVVIEIFKKLSEKEKKENPFSLEIWGPYRVDP